MVTEILIALSPLIGAALVWLLAAGLLFTTNRLSKGG